MYENALRRAFDFIRRFGGGRYTSSTLMRILRAADQAERARMAGSDVEDAPVLLTLGKPFAFNELTEVKEGGPVGMAVYFPGEAGRLLLAVHPEYRRKRFGTVLARLAQIGGRQVTAWVNQRNAEGQQFLLHLGLTPTSMNASGGVCYTAGVEDEGGEEEAPLGRGRLARPRLR